jgi:hypothetical protein
VLRCYHFCNVYLSSIQHGIQSAHAQTEMFVKYNTRSKQKTKLFQWAMLHKTMICLNGGNNQDMLSIFNMLDGSDNPYPWACFYEDDESLNGLLTNIAIVVPFDVYNTAEELRKDPSRSAMDYYPDSKDFFNRYLTLTLKNARLAS